MEQLERVKQKLNELKAIDADFYSFNTVLTEDEIMSFEKSTTLGGASKSRILPIQPI